MTTPTAALVEEAQSMTTDTLIEEAMGEMHRLGIDNLRAKGAIILLSEALRRAEAERDAQHEQVLRLTAERDEARVQLRAANDFLRVVTLERDHAQQVEVPDAFWQLDEARAQVWGLICVATNCAIKADKGFPALRQVLDQRDELTATRDLLTAENARLQKEVATLELLLRGGK